MNRENFLMNRENFLMNREDKRKLKKFIRRNQVYWIKNVKIMDPIEDTPFKAQIDGENREVYLKDILTIMMRGYSYQLTGEKIDDGDYDSYLDVMRLLKGKVEDGIIKDEENDVEYMVFHPNDYDVMKKIVLAVMKVQLSPWPMYVPVIRKLLEKPLDSNPLKKSRKSENGVEKIVKKKKRIK